MIVVIGTGNLAWHLVRVLPGEVVCVSRRGDPIADWPVRVVPLASLGDGTGLRAIFLAVPDNRIAEVSASLAALLPPTLPVYHTSGATAVNRIDPHFTDRGVLWPIRSLRRGEAVTDWRDLPLVVGGNHRASVARLAELAHAMSDSVTVLDDKQRAQLHLAAVFSNNFVTALYDVAHQLCKQHGIPFDLLLPIIRKTAGQQDGSPPRLRQTGAAARGDTATLQRHLDLLSEPAYRRVYRMMSELILQYRLPEHDPHLGGDPDDDL